MLNVDALTRLAAWYKAQCDGEWEHSYGVRLTTLDNPGWALDIDLEETALDGISQERRQHEEGPGHWIHSWSDGTVYHARCDPDSLSAAIGGFLAFADSHTG